MLGLRMMPSESELSILFDYFDADADGWVSPSVHECQLCLTALCLSAYLSACASVGMRVVSVWLPMPCCLSGCQYLVVCLAANSPVHGPVHPSSSLISLSVCLHAYFCAYLDGWMADTRVIAPL